ncbi:MAG: DEAD/DEAH box helicase family protein [Clostridiales bacterium]|nr:DEAD/DEAH box helicase family protein [Clostridiales bacterium]
MSSLRQSVSDSCAEAGLRDLGIYKLEVPTGGGKTLSSLRFALEHAKRHNLDRIIFIIPYLSILSQTVDEIRRALGADAHRQSPRRVRRNNGKK